jgi:hypothetical protein
LYIFHYDPLEPGYPSSVRQETVDQVVAMIESSWGAERINI